MSVRRRFSFLSQARVDVPHLRSIESAVSNDFDELLKGFVTGTGGYVLRGFELNMTGAIGGASSGLQMLTANGTIFHGGSSQSGTFYVVPSTQTPEILNSVVNTKVRGAFTPNAVNYVGIEYERVIDDATADQLYVWDPTNKNEITKTVPLAKILNYTIVITTSVWAQTVLPIAKVTTDVAANVVDITDQRSMLFRLGQAGRGSPNPGYEYPWTNQAEGRVETTATSSSNSINPFRGGDKQLYNLKEWMDAVMTSFKEIKGTTFWYGQNVGGSLVSLRADLANLVFTGVGTISHDAATAGKINWSNDVYIKFIGGRLGYKILANAATSNIVLADDQVAYIKLVREQNIVPNLIFTNGNAVVTSVGAVSWTSTLVAGDWVKLASDDLTKYYQILSVDSLSQVTLSTTFAGTSTGPSGAKSQYAFGVYSAVAVPSTDRHVKISARKDTPFDEDTFWILMRSDNGGATPRVYARFIAAELEQGEERQINDNTTDNIVTYIGSSRESDNSPVYSDKISPLVANYYVVDTESLTKSIKRLDKAIYTAQQVTNQDRAAKLVEGGTWSWDLGTQTLTWSANAAIQVLGLANSVNLILASAAVLTSGQVLYVDANRAAPGGTITPVVGTNTSVATGDDRFILARREGTDVIVGSHSMRLVDGESKKLYAGASDQTLAFIGATNAAESAPTYSSTPAGSLVLPDYNGVANEDLETRLAKVTAMLADTRQDLNIALDAGTIGWDGTNITITSAQLSIPGTVVGAAPVAINNLGSTALASNQCLYVDISRTLGTALTLAVAAISALTPSQQRLIVARNIGGNILVA
jgi:hypothetical protein